MFDSESEDSTIDVGTIELIKVLQRDVEEIKRKSQPSTTDLVDIKAQFDEVEKRLVQIEELLHHKNQNDGRGNEWYVKNASYGSFNCKIDGTDDVVDSNQIVKEILDAFKAGRFLDITRYSAVDTMFDRKVVFRDAIGYRIFQVTGKKPRFEMHDAGNFDRAWLIYES